MKKIAGYFLIAVSGGMISLGAYKYMDNSEEQQAMLIQQLHEAQQNNNHQVNYAVPAEAAVDFTTAAERTVNAVVHVKTIFEIDNGYYSYDPIRQFFFGDGIHKQPPLKGAGAGSGVIISEDGYIVTNNHVIENASKIEVTMNNNKTYEAEVIGRDPSTDLALLKVNANHLPSISYGNSDHVRVGEWVLAVGNPFNLESTVTAGIVSAKGRSIGILGRGNNNIPAVESFIQTDAAVNPGNSGGALVNARGELIGINAAIKSNTGSYMGYSFAIPVNIVTKVVEDLLEFGTVQRGFLGVSIRNIDQDLANEKHLAVLRGVYVAGTMDNGGAEDAGIKEGDIILKVSGTSIQDVPQLQEQISRYRPGDKVLVTVDRKGEILDVPVVLRNRFGSTEIVEKETLDVHSMLGARFEDIDDKTAQNLNIENGVKVESVTRGKLQSAGIMEGFIITKVDQVPVKNKEDLYNRLEEKQGGVLIEGIYPNGKKAYYGFGL